MPITARRHVRKMRGGAQSHLIEASDGRFYIVKFQNNPQHRRILVNELVSAVFLKYLQISSADAAVIEVLLHVPRVRRAAPAHEGEHPLVRDGEGGEVDRHLKLEAGLLPAPGLAAHPAATPGRDPVVACPEANM